MSETSTSVYIEGETGGKGGERKRREVETKNGWEEFTEIIPIVAMADGKPSPF